MQEAGLLIRVVSQLRPGGETRPGGISGRRGTSGFTPGVNLSPSIISEFISQKHNITTLRHKHWIHQLENDLKLSEMQSLGWHNNLNIIFIFGSIFRQHSDQIFILHAALNKLLLGHLSVSTVVQLGKHLFGSLNNSLFFLPLVKINYYSSKNKWKFSYVVFGSSVSSPSNIWRKISTNSSWLIFPEISIQHCHHESDDSLPSPDLSQSYSWNCHRSFSSGLPISWHDKMF